MTQTAERTTNNHYTHTSNERLLGTPSVQVSEHLVKQSIGFAEFESTNGRSYKMGTAANLIDEKNSAVYQRWVQSHINFKDMLNDPEAIALYLNHSYNQTANATFEDGAPVFGRPATYFIDDRGNLIWSANDKPETTGLVLVRKDGTIEQLGTDKNNRVGVISDISAEDKLYMASNEVIAAVIETGEHAAVAFEDIMKDDTYSTDLICVAFDGVADNAGKTPDTAANDGSDANASKPADRTARTVGARKERAAEKKERTEAAAAAAAANAPLPDSDLTRAFADRIQAQVDATKVMPVLGFSEMVRLEMEKAEAAEKQRITDRVDKYTEKVATFEEIAAEALGRRMKGRLFNPLTSSKKEKVKKDDLNMHLLEGYSRALDGALMKQWLAEGYTDEEAAQMVYEQQQIRQEARAARNHAELRKDKLGSFLDKYANMSKGKKIGITIGAAAAFGVLGVAAGAAGGAFAIAGGIGLAGAKVGKTYFQQRSKIYQTGRDETMRSPDKPVSVSNGTATKRTAAQQVFAGMEHDEKKREKAIQKADRNKKVAVGVAALSAAAIGAGVVMEHGDTIRDAFSKPLMPKIPTEVGNADGDWVTEAPQPAPTPAPEVDFSIDALTVTDGEGWYQTIQEVTGVTDPVEQAAILQKIGPALQEKGWAYPMDDGTWGISRTGTLPKDVLELIKNSR